MEEIIIKLSKKKLLAFSVLGLAFVTVGFVMMYAPETFHSSLNRSIISTRIFGGVVFFFFSTCLFFIVVQLFNKKPGLILNRDGLTDYSSFVSPGFVRWDNIKGFSIVKLGRQKILLIQLKRPEEVMAQQAGLKKVLMNLNRLYSQSSVQISSNSLQCNFEELVRLIEKGMLAHQQGT